MKNAVIVFLLASLVLLSSMVYKNAKVSAYYNKDLKGTGVTNPLGDKVLYLYLFFSKKTCSSCVDMISELNGFANPIIVKGVVPKTDISDIVSIRESFGIKFEIVSEERFDRSFPVVVPALVGSTESGEIVLIMPAVSGSVKYIREYMTRLYADRYSHLK